MRKKLIAQRNMRKSRRGAAIEMAMLFMLIVVIMSAMLVSAVMTQSNRTERDYEAMQQRVVLDQIGEGFCLDPVEYTLTNELDELYEISITDTLLRVYLEGTNESVLTVELQENDNGTYTVTSWSYGE